jgi:nucleoside 2-deoxyribosyltransferase
VCSSDLDPYTIKDPYLSIELEKELERARVQKSHPKETLTIRFDYSSGTKSLTCPIKEIEDARKSINIQTVRLDHHLIAQSDMLVAYLPFPAAGVVSEMLFAHERGKPVYAHYPRYPSPFLDYTCTEIFKTTKELIEKVHTDVSAHA